MKKTIKLISIILVIVMCLTLCPHQAFAAESTSEVTADGGTAETPVVLNVAPAIFSVTIPTGLPVEVNASGGVWTADDAKIVNNSHGPVKVVGMTIEAVDGWTIANYASDLRNEKVDSNQISMEINSCQTTGVDAIAFDANNFNTMLAKNDTDSDECAIAYTAKVTPLSEAFTTNTVANVVFTIDWDKVADGSEPELNQYGFYYNAPYVDSDEYGTYAFVFYEDNTLVYFEDANTAFGYDSEELFPIGERSFEFDESTMILVDDQGFEYKFSEDGKSLENEGYTYTATGTEHGVYYDEPYVSEGGEEIIFTENDENIEWVSKGHYSRDDNYGYFISVDGNILVKGNPNDGSIEIFEHEELPADIISPVITLDEVPETTEASSIIISGTATDNIKVISLIAKVNGEEVEITCDENGYFSFEVSLESVKVTIDITAKDRRGNTTTVTKVVNDLDSYLSVVTPTSKDRSNPTIATSAVCSVTGYAHDSDGIEDLTLESTSVQTFTVASWSQGSMGSHYIYINEVLSEEQISAFAGKTANFTNSEGTTESWIIYFVSNNYFMVDSNYYSAVRNLNLQYGNKITIEENSSLEIPIEDLSSNGAWTADIALTPNSNAELVVIMTDTLGNEFREARYVTYDTSSPKLTILTPESSESSNPTYVVDTTCTVSGTVFDDNGIKSLTVNGEDVEVSEDGSWSTGLTLIEGETLSVTVVATDNANITASETRYVNLDTISPSIEIVYPTGETPSDATEVNNSLGVVKGTVTDNSGIKSLTVNGENVAMDSDGTWSTTISLEESVVTEVKAIAVDNSGKESESVKYVVYYDKTAPDLKVSNPYSTDPNNPNYADSASYTVSGTVFDESGIASVTVDGTSVDVGADGSWSMDIALNEEEITDVSIVATDNKGNVSSTVRYVCYSNVEAYALILDNSADSSNAVPMIFVQEKVAPAEGSAYNSETYGELTVTKVYTEIETTYWDFWDGEKVPWTYSGATSVVVEDVISPISTGYWFWDFDNCSYMNLGLLDTSSVTNMKMMFCDIARSITSFEVVGLEQWDVSNVTNMHTMFGYYGDSNLDSDPINTISWSIGDLSNWDVSNVTSMDSMFARAGKWDPNWSVGDLSNWDVSNVISMGGMFEDAGYSNTIWSIGNIGKWDVSSVTSMAQMFYRAGYKATYRLDLSDWNVTNVTSFASFNYGVSSKIIAPNFN